MPRDKGRFICTTLNPFATFLPFFQEKTNKYKFALPFDQISLFLFGYLEIIPSRLD